MWPTSPVWLFDTDCCGCKGLVGGPPTCFARHDGGGPRQGGHPVEALLVQQALARHVGQRVVQANEDGDGGQGGQAACNVRALLEERGCW